MAPPRHRGGRRVLRPGALAAGSTAAPEEHDGQRRGHGRPRLVPGLPAGPSAAVVAGRRMVAGLVRGLPGRAVLLPDPGAARRVPGLLPALQRRLQARHRPGSGRAAGECLRAGPGAQGPPPRAGALRRRRHLVPLLQGHQRRGRKPRHDHPVQPAHHGWSHRQRAGGGVLVHARARLRAVLPRRARVRAALPASALARGGAARGDGAVPHRRRHLRRHRRGGRLALPTSGADLLDRGRGRCGRSVAHRVLDGPAARHVRVHGEHALREAGLVSRLPLSHRVLVGVRAGGHWRSGRCRSARSRGAHAPDPDRRVRGGVPALARAARVEPALPAVLVSGAVPVGRGRRRRGRAGDRAAGRAGVARPAAPDRRRGGWARSRRRRSAVPDREELGGARAGGPAGRWGALLRAPRAGIPQLLGRVELLGVRGLVVREHEARSRTASTAT